jgi:hypothetical protein
MVYREFIKDSGSGADSVKCMYLCNAVCHPFNMQKQKRLDQSFFFVKRTALALECSNMYIGSIIEATYPSIRLTSPRNTSAPFVSKLYSHVIVTDANRFTP